MERRFLMTMMQQISKYKKIICFFGFDFFGLLLWTIKKGVMINKTFEKNLDESGCKPNKIWSDKGELYNCPWNHGCKTVVLKFIQHRMEEIQLSLKDLL